MILFIVNDKAGHGRGIVIWRKMEARLIEKKMAYKMISSRSEKYTRQQIKEITNTHPIKVMGVIGGDGTIHSVLQEIVHLAIPLAIFPAGSGNDTARMFQLTTNPIQFVDQLQTAHHVEVDIIQANHRFGLTIVGAGIDSMIGQKVNQSSYKLLLGKIKLGPLSYLIALFQVVFTFRAFHTTLTIDGKTESFNQTWVVACGNTSSYGGGLQICPLANPTDGQLQITVFHKLPRFKAIHRLFPTLLQKKSSDQEGITYRIGQNIIIQTSRSLDSVLDGEIIGQTPLHIQIHQGAIRLLITT